MKGKRIAIVIINRRGLWSVDKAKITAAKTRRTLVNNQPGNPARKNDMIMRVKKILKSNTIKKLTSPARTKVEHFQT